MRRNCLPFVSIYTRHIASLHSQTRLYSKSNTISKTSKSALPGFFSTHGAVKAQQSRRQVNIENDASIRSSSKKETRGASTKTSLRRVAVEAERSRGGIQLMRSPKRSTDQDDRIKTVAAYCAAEQYDIAAVSRILNSAGYALDPFHTGLYPQVVHMQIPARSGVSADFEMAEGKPGDVFVFPSGTVVAWNVEERVAKRVISKVLLPAAETSHVARMESEDLEFYEDDASEKSSVTGETIRLGTKPNLTVVEGEDEQASASEEQSHAAAEAKINRQRDTNVVLAKIAFSSGLARSAKLAVLESSLQRYFDSTRTIPTILAKGSRLPFTRSFILRKTGELLSIRAQLNLYSELTDSLPDLFWDSRHELGLEGYFDQVGRALDVGIRIKTLNEKMDYAQEIATVLRERLSEKHGLSLEWSIIILISIEVVFEIIRLLRERRERNDPDSTDSMTRRFLEKALATDR